MKIRPVGPEFYEDGQTERERDPDESNYSFIAIWRTRLTTVVFAQSYGKVDVTSCVHLFIHITWNLAVGLVRCKPDGGGRGVWLRRCEASLQTLQGFVGVMTQLPLRLAPLCVSSQCLSGYNEIDLTWGNNVELAALFNTFLEFVFITVWLFFRLAAVPSTPRGIHSSAAMWHFSFISFRRIIMRKWKWLFGEWRSIYTPAKMGEIHKWARGLWMVLRWIKWTTRKRLAMRLSAETFADLFQ